MELTELDAGRTIQVGIGEEITVRLKENPTTGYRWTIETAGGLNMTEDRYMPGGAIGAAGARVLKFRCVQGGSFELGLKNWREWEGESSVIARFSLRINAR